MRSSSSDSLIFEWNFFETDRKALDVNAIRDI